MKTEDDFVKMIKKGHSIATRYVAALTALKTAGVEFQIPVSRHGSFAPTIEELLEAAESQLATVPARSGASPHRALSAPSRAVPAASAARSMTSLEHSSTDVPAMFAEAAAEKDPLRRGVLFAQASRAVRDQPRSAAIRSNNRPGDSPSAAPTDVEAMFAGAAAEKDPLKRGALYARASRLLRTQKHT